MKQILIYLLLLLAVLGCNKNAEILIGETALTHGPRDNSHDLIIVSIGNQMVDISNGDYVEVRNGELRHYAIVERILDDMMVCKILDADRKWRLDTPRLSVYLIETIPNTQ